MMGEIEHYVDPLNKTHKKFSYVEKLVFPLWSAKAQEDSEKPSLTTSIGEAVLEGIVNSETLGYYLARTYLFLTKVGIIPEKIRFRQHRSKEMAHYAADCWDAEVETSYGWIEVAGHADRTCYDLSAHSKASKTALLANRILAEPKQVTVINTKLEYKNFPKEYKVLSQAIKSFFEEASSEEKEKLICELEEAGSIVIKINGSDFKFTKELISFQKVEEKVSVEKYTPSVIEPAFGLGRITYCVLEHCYRVRASDEQRVFFKFPPCVAPVKVSILPLMCKDEINAFIEPISNYLNKGEVWWRMGFRIRLMILLKVLGKNMPEQMILEFLLELLLTMIQLMTQLLL